MDQKLLDILCCPATKRPVAPLPRADLDRLNQRVKKGLVQQRDGVPVEHPIREALITDDHAWIYRVDDGIPVMLEECAVPGTALDDAPGG